MDFLLNCKRKREKSDSFLPIRKSPPGKKPGELLRSIASLTTSTLKIPK